MTPTRTSSHKAKIFLSCGQREDLGEIHYGEAVRDALEPTFDVFYAKGEQSALSLTEKIFNELRSSDYYVLLDFAREALFNEATELKKLGDHKVAVGVANEIERRGSLFTHQEFAIACFLKLDIAPFREVGVEDLTGVYQNILGNAIWFERSTPSKLAQVVVEHIGKRGWNPQSKNRLELSFAGDKGDRPIGSPISFYHINVENLHHRRAATNCYAYIDKVIDAKTGSACGPRFTCELKWEGTLLQGIRIGPEAKRGLDAFIFNHDSNQLIFLPQTDADNHIEPYPAISDLLVTYVVCCDEFADSRQTFRICSDGIGPVQVIPLDS